MHMHFDNSNNNHNNNHSDNSNKMVYCNKRTINANIFNIISDLVLPYEA